MTMYDSDRYKYRRLKLARPDGKKVYSASNGDAVAKALFGINDAAALVAILDRNGVRARLRADPARMNIGHLRMVVGNILRARLREVRGVHIGEHIVTELT